MHPESTPPLERLLGLLEHVTHRNCAYMASCPAHNDATPSLSLKEADDGRLLLYCFAGCPTEKVVEAVGLEMNDLFATSGTRAGEGSSYPPKNVGYADTRGESGKGITLSAYAKAKRLSKDFLDTVGVRELKNYEGHPAVRFAYLGPEGDELCIRFRVSLDGKPKVLTRRKDKHCLYGLWLVDKFHEKRYAILVEGESDSQTLWLHGFPGLGVPGANSWQSSWAEHLDGFERVFVVVEPDQGGDTLWDRLVASDLIRERLYRVDLGEYSDVSEMHLASDAETFKAKLREALKNATSYLDIAESEEQERRRESWSLCEDLAREKRILDLLAEDLRASGLAGSSHAAQLIYLALNTRHLDAQALVNVVVKGPSAAGKSFTVEKVLEFYPDSGYYFLTAMSERALAYSHEPLSHRVSRLTTPRSTPGRS